MCTFDPKHIIISHQGQQPRYNIIIIGLNDEFETTNYFNYQKNLESFLETCIIMIDRIQFVRQYSGIVDYYN